MAPARADQPKCRSRPGVKATVLRVTHIAGDLHGGGLETLIGGMARRFAGSDVQLSAITLNGRLGRVGEEIRPHLDQAIALRPEETGSMLRAGGLARAIRSTSPDVVHLHSGCWYKGSLAAARAGVPAIVFTEHGREHHDPWIMRQLDRRAARRTHAVVAVSERLSGYLHRVIGVASDRLRVIQNGVDTEAFRPGGREAALRRALGVPADALLVGCVGRLEPVKAFERLIAAVVAVRARGDLPRPVYGVVWGEGDGRRALEAEITRAGLGAVFLLPGWAADPARVHRELDVFSLVSHSEGSSVSLMESMASGVAPVVMDVGTNRELIGDTGPEQVTPAGDVGAFTEALGATLKDSARRQRVGEAVRRRIVERYSFDVMLEQYAALYRELANRARRSSG